MNHNQIILLKKTIPYSSLDRVSSFQLNLSDFAAPKLRRIEANLLMPNNNFPNPNSVDQVFSFPIQLFFPTPTVKDQNYGLENFNKYLKDFPLNDKKNNNVQYLYWLMFLGFDATPDQYKEAHNWMNGFWVWNELTKKDTINLAQIAACVRSIGIPLPKGAEDPLADSMPLRDFLIQENTKILNIHKNSTPDPDQAFVTKDFIEPNRLELLLKLTANLKKQVSDDMPKESILREAFFDYFIGCVEEKMPNLDQTKARGKSSGCPLMTLGFAKIKDSNIEFLFEKIKVENPELYKKYREILDLVGEADGDWNDAWSLLKEFLEEFNSNFAKNYYDNKESAMEWQKQKCSAYNKKLAYFLAVKHQIENLLIKTILNEQEISCLKRFIHFALNAIVMVNIWSIFLTGRYLQPLPLDTFTSTAVESLPPDSVSPASAKPKFSTNAIPGATSKQQSPDFPYSNRSQFISPEQFIQYLQKLPLVEVSNLLEFLNLTDPETLQQVQNVLDDTDILSKF